MQQFDRIDLPRLPVGGEPVGFTKSTGTVHLAGDDMTIEQWREVSRRIELLIDRDGAKQKERSRDPGSGASSFLTKNVQAIHKMPRGYLKKAPWWLRWLIDGIVTKEEYYAN